MYPPKDIEIIVEGEEEEEEVCFMGQIFVDLVLLKKKLFLTN